LKRIFKNWDPNTMFLMVLIISAIILTGVVITIFYLAYTPSPWGCSRLTGSNMDDLSVLTTVGGC